MHIYCYLWQNFSSWNKKNEDEAINKKQIQIKTIYDYEMTDYEWINLWPKQRDRSRNII